ncbi:MAG TPA: type II toxin-antitoxin system RelE/ParE family toxin [Verrucomicrobiae bacterium]|nr:type II toxin-antitoxin system RelE/ParE family toxin [Verrucomicrobiae bacterium]
MKIRWSPDAAADLARIVAYIKKDNRSAAQRTARIIFDQAAALAHSPRIGRQGRIPGTRELPVPPLPFILVYRILEQEAIEIAAVVHGAQRWPPSK